MRHRVYFDNAGTTNVNPEVLKTYVSILEDHFANSEALYEEGRSVSVMMEKARCYAAELLSVNSDEIIFTSGSSESNSAAVKGVCFACPQKKHIITTNTEHSSTLNCCRQMEEIFGYEVTYLPVNHEGKITLSQVKDALREDTAVVSVMAVNNEVGSINPVGEIAAYVKKHSHAYMHVDLTQAIGKIPVAMKDIDLAAISAHKLEGLKGSGLLIKKKHVPFVPLINGGEQEGGLRGGTSNAPANILFAKTLRLYLENCRKHEKEIKEMSERLKSGLCSIPGVELNSPPDAVSSIINFSYEPIPSEVMQNALDQKGFMVSARSTCDSKAANESYVLKAMGFSARRASSCIRISLFRHNTDEDIDTFLSTLKEIIELYGTV